MSDTDDTPPMGTTRPDPQPFDGEREHEMIVMVKVKRYGTENGLDDLIPVIRRELEMRLGPIVTDVWRGQ